MGCYTGDRTEWDVKWESPRLRRLSLRRVRESNSRILRRMAADYQSGTLPLGHLRQGRTLPGDVNIFKRLLYDLA